MAKFLETKSLGYNDVVLIAQPGNVRSRKDIPIEGERIVVSAMTSIIGQDFIKAVASLPIELQPTIQIPRDLHVEENLKLAEKLGLTRIFVGVGINTPKLETLAKQLGYNTLFLDVANGYLPQVKEKVKDLKNQGFNVIAGSVHTEIGAIDLANAGCDVIKSGISSGFVCTTKDATGYNRSPITDILSLAKVKEGITEFYDCAGYKITCPPYKVLADGGLSSAADVSKAFLAGADYVMSGRLFVDAEEARLRKDGTDIYYGQASHLGKQAMGNELRNIEGRVQKLSRENVKSLESIMNNIWDGLRSAVSYSGYTSLSEAIGNGVFEIKHS